MLVALRTVGTAGGENERDSGGKREYCHLQRREPTRRINAHHHANIVCRGALTGKASTERLSLSKQRHNDAVRRVHGPSSTHGDQRLDLLDKYAGFADSNVSRWTLDGQGVGVGVGS